MTDGWVEQWASYSSLAQHRSCPQKWQYAHIRRLEKYDPTDIPVWRDFGNWWHLLRAADSIRRGTALGSLRLLPKRLRAVEDSEEWRGDERVSSITVSDVLAAAEAWWHKQPQEITEVWRSSLGEDLADRLVGLNERYHEQWGEELKDEQPLAAEMVWRRMLPALPGPRDTITNPEVMLIGYVDEIYFDARRRLVVARDHKSHKALSTQTTADDLMDSQLQLYAWGASPTVTEWGCGQIKATAYDRVKVVAPRPPQLTLGGRLRVAGGVPSVGSSDLHTYVTWAAGEDGQGVWYPGTAKDGSGQGYYTAEPAIVEKLASPSSTSVWFQRTLTPLNSHVIKTHLRAAVDTASDMAHSRARAVVSGEAGRNLTDGCRWCDFNKLCRAEMVGGVDGDYDLEVYGLRQREG